MRRLQVFLQLADVITVSPARGSKVQVVRLGDGGGLASKLQMAAGRMARALQRGARVSVTGHLGRYSNNSGCLRLQGAQAFLVSGWTCHFLPLPGGLLSLAGTEKGIGGSLGGPRRPWGRLTLMSGGPGGMPGWWRSRLRCLAKMPAVQALLWRPNRYLAQRFAVLAGRVGYDASRPLLALHVRRGDKVTNFYNRYHPASTYVNEAIQAAKELQICANSSHTGGRVGEGKATRSALSTLLPPCQLFVASDSPTAIREVRQAVRRGWSTHGRLVEVIGLASSETQQRSAVGIEVAAAMAGDGLSFEMASEVLFDIELLSRAQILVGTLASQITRVAASLGSKQGTLLRAIALDVENLLEMSTLFAPWGIPVDDVPWIGPAF